MKKASTQYSDWTGTIAIENVESKTKSLNVIFSDELQENEKIIEITVSSENHKIPEAETIVEVTVKTNEENEYQKQMTIQNFIDMFFRFEIKLERKG
jgi:hypothetical protein